MSGGVAGGEQAALVEDADEVEPLLARETVAAKRARAALLVDDEEDLLAPVAVEELRRPVLDRRAAKRTSRSIMPSSGERSKLMHSSPRGAPLALCRTTLTEVIARPSASTFGYGPMTRASSGYGGSSSMSERSPTLRSEIGFQMPTMRSRRMSCTATSASGANRATIASHTGRCGSSQLGIGDLTGMHGRYVHSDCSSTKRMAGSRPQARIERPAGASCDE